MVHVATLTSSDLRFDSMLHQRTIGVSTSASEITRLYRYNIYHRIKVD